jgi:hypothetical protein
MSDPRRHDGEAAPHVTICFAPDGQTHFYPEGAFTMNHARRLAAVIVALHENPARILCALRLCGTADSETGHVH